MKDRLFVIDLFRSVDSRFGHEWPIPFEEVSRVLAILDSYWKKDSPYDYSAKGLGWLGSKRSGLAFLLSPTQCDYDDAVKDIAVRHKARRSQQPNL